MNLALLLNKVPTTQKETGNKPTIFIDFSGYIAVLFVKIHTQGWISGKSADKEFKLYTDETDLSLSIEALDECFNYLKGLYIKQVTEEYKCQI